MDELENALKILAEKGYIISAPKDKIVYLVDHGPGVPMTTRRTLNPTKGRFNKTEAQRVALINLEKLEWIIFEEVDFDKKDGE